MKLRSAATALAIPVLAALALTGCSASTPGAGASSGGPIRVAASTDVYGDIASTIGGGAVTVTSILSDPNQDPHGFEADARTQLAISKAQIVVENGGGYDDYVDTMLASTSSKATVVNAVKLSGFPTGGDFNEHVFYDYPSMIKVANAVAADLAKIQPSKAATFFANAQTFKTALAKLQNETIALKAAHEGEKVAYTEPVPGYLFDAIGLVDETPAAFSKAVEEGSDVPPAALNDTLSLMRGRAVRLLAYNEQASSPETTQVEAAAKKAGVPVVPVTETLPQGDDYVSWQQANIDAVSSALSKR